MDPRGGTSSQQTKREFWAPGVSGRGQCPGKGTVLLLMELLRTYTEFLLHSSTSGTFPSTRGGSKKPKAQGCVGSTTPNALRTRWCWGSQDTSSWNGSIGILRGSSTHAPARPEWGHSHPISGTSEHSQELAALVSVAMGSCEGNPWPWGAVRASLALGLCWSSAVPPSVPELCCPTLSPGAVPSLGAASVSAATSDQRRAQVSAAP